MGVSKSRFEVADAEFRTWTERLNETISDAESKAAEINPGHDVHVHLRTVSDDDEFPEFAEFLGMVKIKDRWRLAFGTCSVDDPTDLDWTPLLECSLDQRLSASGHIEDLLEALLVAREAQARNAHERVMQLRKVLSSFSEKVGGVE